MSIAPTRRHDDFNYRLPDDLEFHPTKHQIANTVRGARGTSYGPVERWPLWVPYLCALFAIAVVVGIAGYVLVRMVG